MLAHMVYFTLKDNSESSKQNLVSACKKYLSHQDGIVFFAVGTRAEVYQRPVNDKEFDVALHLVFTDRAAHDSYQEHPDHLRFIAENKEGWKSVRVFDADADR
ncbi:MAG: Dabb family protein [Planctomycetota bacterium]